MSQRDQSKSRAQKGVSPHRGWARIKTAAEYADVDPRIVRDWLKQGLKHARTNRKTVLIPYDAIDEFLENFIVDPAAYKEDLDRLADDVMRDLKSTRRKAA